MHFWDDFRRKVDKRFAALSSFLAKQVQTSSREITFDGRNARKAALPAAPPLYGVLRGPASSGPSEGVGQAPVSDKRPVVKAEEAAGADAGGKYPAASVIAAGHSDAAAPSLTPIAAVKATTGTLSTPAYGLSSDAPGRVGEDGRTVPYEKRGREEGEGSEGGQGAEKRRKVAESLQESSDVEIVA